MIEAELVWEIRSELGEGPIWWNDSLYWVDINAPRLHVYTPATEDRQLHRLQYRTVAGKDLGACRQNDHMLVWGQDPRRTVHHDGLGPGGCRVVASPSVGR